MEPVLSGNGNPVPSVSEETLNKIRALESLVQSEVLSPQAFDKAIDNLGVMKSGSGYLPKTSLTGVVSGGDGQGPDVVTSGVQGTSVQARPGQGVAVIGGQTGVGAIVDDDDSETLPATAEFRQLFDLVASLFPESKSVERAPPPSFIRDASGEDTTSQAQTACRFSLYDRVDRVREDMSSSFESSTKEGKKPSSVLYKRRSCYKVSGDNEFSGPPVVNDSLARISTTRPSNSASV